MIRKSRRVSACVYMILVFIVEVGLCSKDNFKAFFLVIHLFEVGLREWRIYVGAFKTNDQRFQREAPVARVIIASC